jgi:hypothetical protein
LEILNERGAGRKGEWEKGGRKEERSKERKKETKLVEEKEICYKRSRGTLNIY